MVCHDLYNVGDREHGMRIRLTAMCARLSPACRTDQHVKCNLRGKRKYGNAYKGQEPINVQHRSWLF